MPEGHAAEVHEVGAELMQKGFAPGKLFGFVADDNMGHMILRPLR
jgi:hypothetical protein